MGSVVMTIVAAGVGLFVVVWVREATTMRVGADASAGSDVARTEVVVVETSVGDSVGLCTSSSVQPTKTATDGAKLATETIAARRSLALQLTIRNGMYFEVATAQRHGSIVANNGAPKQMSVTENSNRGKNATSPK